MLVLKLTTAFALMGAASAAAVVQHGPTRAQCISSSLDQARARASQADAVVCYHGGYDLLNQNANTFGHLSSVKCGEEEVDVECFWMDDPAIFNAHDDGGPENIAYSLDTNKCTWDHFWRSLNCQGGST
jgi:hypothetical protein